VGTPEHPMERRNVYNQHSDGGAYKDTHKVPLVGDRALAEGIRNSGFHSENLKYM
jgi:hypothetical protein